MSIYAHFDQYDFENDPSFQAGLPNILGSATASLSEEQKSQLIQRAKWFYYSKTKEPFDYDGYLEWKANGRENVQEKTSSQSISASQPQEAEADLPISINTAATTTNDSMSPALSSEPAYPRSFADIVELIQSGKPIPGIRDIPNKLNDHEPTKPELTPKRKPWEQ